MSYDFEARFITGRNKENPKLFFNALTLKTGEPGKEVICLLECELFKFKLQANEHRIVRQSMVDSMFAADASAARHTDYDFKPAMCLTSDSKSGLCKAIACDISFSGKTLLPDLWLEYFDEVIPDDFYHPAYTEHTEESYAELLKKDLTYQLSLSQQEKSHDNRDNTD